MYPRAVERQSKTESSPGQRLAHYLLIDSKFGLHSDRLRDGGNSEAIGREKHANETHER